MSDTTTTDALDWLRGRIRWDERLDDLRAGAGVVVPRRAERTLAREVVASAPAEAPPALVS
jgi:hypothetical protein